MIEEPVIDLQHVLESFNIDLTRDASGKVISHNNPGANLLFIIDSNIPVKYRIKYGGAVKPDYIEVRGFYIPLMYNWEIYMPQVIDHYNGCSNLNYATHPELVEKYVERLSSLLNDPNPIRKLYLDPGLRFKIPKEFYKDIYEGIVPVLVSGKSVTGLNIPHDNPVRAFIVTGNCV